jgi:hypothetical protein
VEFNQSIESLDFPKLENHLLFVAERITTGYHSLEIISKKNLNYTLSHEGSVFYLDIALQEQTS